MHNFRVNYGSRRDISTTAALPTKRKLQFGEYFLLAILPSTSSLRSSGKRRVWWRFWTTIKVTGGSYPGSSFRQALRMAESSHWSTWNCFTDINISSGVNFIPNFVLWQTGPRSRHLCKRWCVAVFLLKSTPWLCWTCAANCRPCSPYPQCTLVSIFECGSRNSIAMPEDRHSPLRPQYSVCRNLAGLPRDALHLLP